MAVSLVVPGVCPPAQVCTKEEALGRLILTLHLLTVLTLPGLCHLCHVSHLLSEILTDGRSVGGIHLVFHVIHPTELRLTPAGPRECLQNRHVVCGMKARGTYQRSETGPSFSPLHVAGLE